ncbi:MAG: nicotinate (nicotinamide) nucleotide adenylyltransferase [Bacillota bacterium]|nr:MAG: nicotinate (nicotinamide) nucleotide adenylyltransferase [Bacillota bacterium]
MVIVFGGSFNPPTRAHLEIIKKLLDTFKDSTVLVLPVGNDYKKRELEKFHHRFDMLKLLCNGMDRVIISDLEAKKTYNGTLGSLKELSKTYHNLHFVIGSDNLKDFHTWISYQELLKTYPFIVMKRETGLTEEDTEVLFKDLEHHFTFIPFSVNIESSKIRKSVHERKTDLTHEVYEYIQKNHLYGA